MAAPPTVSAVASPSAEESAAADPPVMGWSSWNTYHVNISDTLIMRQADAMVAKGLKAAGYRYINIDDGFFGYRDSTGLMHAHPQRFPRGLRPVADYIHSLGFKAGIYSDAGSHTCGSRYDNDENGFWAGLYGHERQDAELYFNDWGFDFIKIDYCGAGTELNLDERRRYTEISEAFKSVGCGDVEINICRWAFPGTWARSIARSWRISPDIRPRWSSVKRIIDLNLYLSAYCGGGHYNDMDMLEIGRGMPRNEEEVHFGMWCIMSSPLMIGCDMQTIPEASLSLIKNEELIALNQDPLGLQAYVVQHEGEGYVLTKDIGRRRGTERAVALYNPSDSACHFNVPLSLLELGGRVRLRDLVRRCDLEPVSDSIVCDLPARSLRLLRAEGLYRTDPVAYEAEWAYLPCFDALGKVKHRVLYAARLDSIGMGLFRERLGVLCRGLIEKYPRAQIVFFTPWVCDGFAGSNRERVVDAMLSVCGSYGIPVFDAARRGGIYAGSATFRRIYFQGGGTRDTAHLNSRGHDRFLPVAESFILQYTE